MMANSKEISKELDPTSDLEERKNLVAINGHRFKESRLQLRLLMATDDVQ